MHYTTNALQMDKKINNFLITAQLLHSTSTVHLQTPIAEQKSGWTNLLVGWTMCRRNPDCFALSQWSHRWAWSDHREYGSDTASLQWDIAAGWELVGWVGCGVGERRRERCGGLHNPEPFSYFHHQPSFPCPAISVSQACPHYLRLEKGYLGLNAHNIRFKDEISFWKKNRINFCNIGNSFLNYKSVYIRGYCKSRSIKAV